MSRCLLLPWLLTACLPQWPGGEEPCPLGSGLAKDGQCYPIDTASGPDSAVDTATDDTGENTDAQIWYQDADQDGYGNPDTPLPVEGPAAGYVDNAEDCDDTNAEVNPSTPELYGDGLDNNCDGETDEPSSVVGGYTGDIEITREYTAGNGGTYTDTCTGNTVATVYSNESSVFLYGTYTCSGTISISGYFYSSTSSTTFSGGNIHSEGVNSCASAWGQSFAPTSQPISGAFYPNDLIRFNMPEGSSCLTTTLATYSGQIAIYRD